MKEEIVNYFKKDRSHAGGVALVIKHSNRLALKKQINVHPQSEYLTGVVHEELRDLAGISPDDLQDLFSVPVVKESQAAPEVHEPSKPEVIPAVKKPVEKAEPKKAGRKK